MTNIEILKLYIAKNVDALKDVICAPQAQLEALMLGAWAIKDDDVEILNIALQHCDPLQNNSMLLRQAVELGSAKCFDVLLPISDPLANNSEALQWAIYYDRTNMFNRLVNVCNISDAINEIASDFDGAVFRRAQMILEEQNAHKQAARIEDALSTPSATPKSKKI